MAIFTADKPHGLRQTASKVCVFVNERQTDPLVETACQKIALREEKIRKNSQPKPLSLAQCLFG